MTNIEMALSSMKEEYDVTINNLIYDIKDLQDKTIGEHQLPLIEKIKERTGYLGQITCVYFSIEQLSTKITQQADAVDLP